MSRPQYTTDSPRGKCNRRDSRDLDYVTMRLESDDLDDEERETLRECKRQIERRIPRRGRR